MTNLTRTTLAVLPVLTLSAILVLGNKLPQAASSNSGKILQVTGNVSVSGATAISGATVS